MEVRTILSESQDVFILTVAGEKCLTPLVIQGILKHVSDSLNNKELEVAAESKESITESSTAGKEIRSGEATSGSDPVDSPA